MSRFQTDALVPTALNTGILGRKRNADIGGASSSFLNTENQVSAADERDKFAEEWNLRIDKEVKVVAGGLKGLVELANIGENPAPHSATPSSLHLKVETARLIRAVQSLRDMAHEMKLMLLLSDEVGAVSRRDAEAEMVSREVSQRREGVAKEFRRLMGGEGEDEVGVEVEEELEEVGLEDEVPKEQSPGGPEGGDEKLEEAEDPAAGPKKAEVEYGNEDKDDDSDDFEEV